jgi:glutamate/tyrosine decarboxylase-like PLP-dependent enzyme
MIRLPRRGLDRESIQQQLEAFTEHDFAWRSGKSFAYTYDAGRDVEQVAHDAYLRYMSKNALDPTFFPSVLELENQIVSMAASHLGGDEQTVGTFTCGGTESIILAVKSARDYFRHVRPEIKEPEMVLPATGHAAFHKAAHYLGVKPVVTPVDPRTFRADPEQMRRAVTENTILLVGSATSYAHGVVDPIAGLGRLALEHGLLLHVDGCIGGFLLPYFRRFGAEIPDFDLSVPGVTSISMDLHKYAYAPKGASVVLYKSLELRRHQIYACAEWTGYTVVNTTVQSTKGAGPLAAAWAVMRFLGDEGYERLARQLYDATQRIIEGIESIEQLRLLTRPEMPLVAFTSDQVNVFVIIDEMARRGWHLQAQLSLGDYQENIHLSVNPNNLGHVDAMLADLEEIASRVKAKPRGKLAKLASATFRHLDPEMLDDALFAKIIGMAGIKSVGLPDAMADINDIMNLLPPKLSERLLIEYVNRLFVHPGVDATKGLSKTPHRLPTGPRKGGRMAAWASIPGTRRAWSLTRTVCDRLSDIGVPLPRL